MAISRAQTYGAVTILGAGLFLGMIIIPRLFPEQYMVLSTDVRVDESANVVESKEIVTHVDTPEQVKTIYMSQCVVGTPSFREKLMKIAEETEINSIIIDIKDYTGMISFDTVDPLLSHAISTECGASDMKEFIKTLHEKGIYVIGRITVFQDPHMSARRPDLAVQSKGGGVWKDFKGLSFIDVGAREHWDYIIALAKEAYNIGFDEINFDYIRFPSDGKMDDAVYTHSVGKSKPEALREFFVYLHEHLKDTGMKTSVDLFGMTTTNTDDLNIGQVIENAFPFFDYIAPMVYPSHYPKGFNGWNNPNNYIYEVVYMSMKSAYDRAVAFDALVTNPPASSTPPSVPADFKPQSPQKLRTWIQDFDYGGNYDVAEVKEQIQASYDAGVMSWMIWSPSNKYTIGALLKE